MMFCFVLFFSVGFFFSPQKRTTLEFTNFVTYLRIIFNLIAIQTTNNWYSYLTVKKTSNSFSEKKDVPTH